ncbi:Leucine-rich repeat receptor protein kinase EMS1 [Linum grandiflorum]
MNMTDLSDESHQLGFLVESADRINSAAEWTVFETARGVHWQQYLQGTISATLGGLSSLVKLNLTCNRLHGLLPSTVSNLKQLGHIKISYNWLESALPSSLSRMSNLVALFLQGNRISGSLTGCYNKMLK